MAYAAGGGQYVAVPVETLNQVLKDPSSSQTALAATEAGAPAKSMDEMSYCCCTDTKAP
ncbi:hypothetical protein AB0323_07715 [Arthrobacter sp. NPDC080031]|uniref:hypothetical protein n=1 Tax=Arthrobacter sp. NPDC080031 TaxID=3155918 RepID=UPI00344DC9D8